jgi:hypothetical protein
MVIYLNSFRAAKSAPAAWLKDGTYGDDVMQAGWKPAAIHVLHAAAPVVASQDLPHDMSNVDVEAFLGRVYGVASLI